MKKLHKSLLIIFCSIFITKNSVAEETAKINAVKTFMLELGLENISFVQRNENNYVISYENRSFLHEIQLLGVILSGLRENIERNSVIEIFPKSKGKTLLKIKLNYQDYINYSDRKLTQDEFSKKIDIIANPTNEINTEIINPLFLHSDLVLNPSFDSNLFVGQSILFSPYININFDKGFSFTTKYRIPVFNVENGFNFIKNNNLFPHGPVNAFFDYSLPVPEFPIYSTFRTGFFKNSYYNLTLNNETRYMILDGKINFILSSGVIFDINRKLFDFSISPYLQIYEGNWDLILETGGGKFMNGKYSLWGKLTRQFENTDISFSLNRVFDNSESGWNFSFEFNITIGPEHSINPSLLRITYPRNFGGNIYAGAIPAYSLPVSLTQDFIKRLYPEYIRTHLYYWLNGE